MITSLHRQLLAFRQLNSINSRTSDPHIQWHTIQCKYGFVSLTRSFRVSWRV
uniref:Uncharacterized protein n=1 Tax=Anopheles christyi TaxID=43041 RepID=A0A182KIP1_9DIPT